MSFQSIDPNNFEINPFTSIGSQWMLLTAGDENAHNTMTVSWGALGVLWFKNVSFAFVRPQRYTIEFMNKHDTFSLCLFDEIYKPALKLCGTKSGRDLDKDAAAGLTPLFDREAPYYQQANTVLLCRKLSKQRLDPTCFIDPEIDPKVYPKQDHHYMFVGEILSILKQD